MSLNNNSKANPRTTSKSKGYNSKGRNRNSNGKGKEVAKDESTFKPKQDTRYDDLRSNDISWWDRSPLYDDSTNFNFKRTYGAPIKMPSVYQSTTDFEILESNEAVPGIMSISYVPGIGDTSAGSNAPVNRAFTSLYGEIFSHTSGTLPFQQADMALFMTGMSSLIGYIGHIKRILAVSELYAAGENLYYPRALLTALKVNPSDVIGKQDLIRSRLNNIIGAVNSLRIPDVMSVYKRQYSLAHNVYADEDSIRSQLYVFVPEGLYTYVDTESKLRYLEIGAQSSFVEVNFMLDVMTSCVQSWLDSSDVGLFTGAMLRAFKDSAPVSLDYVVSGEVIIPTVDRNMTWQINNLDTLNVDSSSLDITQNVLENTIVWNPKIFINDPITPLFNSMRYKWLNSYDGDESKEFFMEATRLMNCPTDIDEPNSIKHPNTEIVTGFTIFWYERNGTNPPTLQSARYSSCTSIQAGQPGNSLITKMEGLTRLSKFRNAPRVHLFGQKNIGDNSYEPCGYLGDVYQYTLMDEVGLQQLNNAALLSIYQTILPSGGRLIK
jgi:hypothetical protein